MTKSVAEKDKHTLNGDNLEVTKEMAEKHKEAAKTIMVTCLAAKTTEDSLWNYFENERRSGGGAVESVTNIIIGTQVYHTSGLLISKKL